VGGENSFPFYLFEGTMPHPPKIAMEVPDCPPDEWPKASIVPFHDVINDPVAWAKKCVSTYGAEMIALQLVSTDPNGLNRTADEAAALVKKVADAIDVPLIIYGTANHEKDTQVLTRVCEVCQDKRLIIGPVEEKDYKKIAAATIAYKHTVIASSPIDINLAKQLNILLGNLGVADDMILMDPTVSGIGYGLEYCYSVIERMRMAGLTQQDEKLQLPIICNLSKEVWKSKEVNQPDNDSNIGNAKNRGILMEAMSAMALLLAGGDIIIMRHPEAIELIKEMVVDLTA
jgi:acetyl-CoA decarbonylase/synthase complex subunit delta